MDKFQRSYYLEVENQNGEMVVIEPPFTIEFDIMRNVASSQNVCKLRVYNLGEKTRNSILKNPLITSNRKFTLKAGYGSNLPTVLVGSVNQCYSVREKTNFVTTIEGYDSGYSYNYIIYKGPPFPSGTKIQTVIETLIKSLDQYGIGIGAISHFTDDKLKRAMSVTGSTIEKIKELTQNRFYIDKDLVYAVTDNKAIEGDVTEINFENGLLNTPTRNQTYLNFEILFEPRLIMGQKIIVNSSTAKNYSGNYKIVSIHHKGTISDSVAGMAITEVGCLAGDLETQKMLGGFLL